LPKNPWEFPNEANDGSSLLSFVVHLWKEESAFDGQQTSWRGHITSVSNGERHYFTDINQIPEFIIAYLNLRK
jgi:hypothetical protein